MTGLHWASVKGHRRCVRALLERGADANLSDLETGQTALHLAAANGHIQCARALLRSGANVDELSPLGFTPLAMAALGGHAEVATLLVREGAVVSQEVRNAAAAFKARQAPPPAEQQGREQPRRPR